ncbi:hypothetical protein B0H63DRAFT_519837 [Podospora didyma]|uniref:Uncharacterized protein n=1 Tax=Podospora didyma TaxID=330526 RepID=A0AAE0NZJ7_9PEZI|nr:hypothetical protein B0H63DRAFT_519837 [Podospora didyma]
MANGSLCLTPALVIYQFLEENSEEKGVLSTSADQNARVLCEIFELPDAKASEYQSVPWNPTFTTNKIDESNYNMLRLAIIAEPDSIWLLDSADLKTTIGTEDSEVFSKAVYYMEDLGFLSILSNFTLNNIFEDPGMINFTTRKDLVTAIPMLDFEAIVANLAPESFKGANVMTKTSAYWSSCGKVFDIFLKTTVQARMAYRTFQALSPYTLRRIVSRFFFSARFADAARALVESMAEKIQDQAKHPAIVDQYRDFEHPIPEGLTEKVDGKQTLDENIADAGGPRASYDA